MVPTYLQKCIATRGPKHHKDTIGLEIEVEGRNLPLTIFAHWVVHDDGSLRGQENAEYVLRQPVSRKALEEALVYLEEKFKESGAELDNDSDRTSVHVHLNVQDRTWAEVFTFWTLWTIIEDLSFELCGTERRGNLFCLRVKDAEGLIQAARLSFEEQALPFQFNDYRYAACNLNATNKFGSIEFRGMHGTVNAEEILRWVDFLRNCLRASAKFKNPHEVIAEFSKKGPQDFLTSIFDFPRDILRTLQNHPDWRKSLWEGMRLAQDIAWLITDWGEKTIKEESPKKEKFYDTAEPDPDVQVDNIRELRIRLNPWEHFEWSAMPVARPPGTRRRRNTL